MKGLSRIPAAREFFPSVVVVVVVVALGSYISLTGFLCQQIHHCHKLTLYAYKVEG